MNKAIRKIVVTLSFTLVALPPDTSCLTMPPKTLKLSMSRVPSKWDSYRNRKLLATTRGPRGRLPPLEDDSYSPSVILVKEILVNMVELDDPADAPSLLAPHLSTLVKSNVMRIGEDLCCELKASGILTKDSEEESITAAAEYITSFVEEVVVQLDAISRRHSDLLREIVETAKENPTGLDELLWRARPKLDASFILHLRGELKNVRSGVEDTVLSELLASIEMRILEEIEAMTSEDKADFVSILQVTDGEDARITAFNSIIAR